MARIYEFNPLIYPTRIWVGINVSFQEVADKFYALASDGTVTDFSEAVKNHGMTSIATCYPVGDKKTNWKGIFCHIYRPKLMTTGVIAHEAEHIVCWICEQFDIDSKSFDDSEPRAYLIQWIADCIDKVKNRKVENKDNNLT